MSGDPTPDPRTGDQTPDPRTGAAAAPARDDLATVTDLTVRFGGVTVLDRVSLAVPRGRTVGVVGESGSGKSTLALAMVGAVRAASGSVLVAGTEVTTARRRELARYRRRVQLVPQDPYSSLSPRRTVGQTLAEAVDPVHADLRRHRALVETWLQRVGLDPAMADRYPHEFSGGQRQRVAIARGLIVEPELVIADEITSALDVSVQRQVLDLLAQLQASLGLTLVFISHNLAVVQQISDEVAVLYRGHLVEHGPAARLYDAPEHPYTRSLLDADPGSPGFTLDAVPAG